MKVRELFEELSHFDPEAIVECENDDVLGVKRTEIGSVEIVIPEREEVEW